MMLPHSTVDVFIVESLPFMTYDEFRMHFHISCCFLLFIRLLKPSWFWKLKLFDSPVSILSYQLYHATNYYADLFFLSMKWRNELLIASVLLSPKRKDKIPKNWKKKKIRVLESCVYRIIYWAVKYCVRRCCSFRLFFCLFVSSFSVWSVLWINTHEAMVVLMWKVWIWFLHSSFVEFY
jgi:hypothetical protein